MRSFGSKRKFLYQVSEWVYVFATTLAAFIGWVNGVEKDDPWLKNRPVVWAALEYIQDHTVYLYLAIGIVVFLCVLYRRMGDPWILEKLQFILDEYQFKVFSASGAPQDHDRVTIFKHCKNHFWLRHWSCSKWYWRSGKHPFWSDYLIPVLRSGHISKKSKAIFYAPDGSDKAEGVASMAWSKKGSVVLNQLPVIKSNTGVRDKEKYARATKCDLALLDKYIAEGRQPPSSIAAMVIECNGRPWGVLVLDSRSPNGVTDDSVDNYTLTIALIGHLLERA